MIMTLVSLLIFGKMETVDVERDMLGIDAEAGEARMESPRKLITSALSAWEVGGAAEISARGLAAMAGLPVSAIHYHFGGLGHLLDAAQAEAIASARRWSEAQWEAVGTAATAPAMLGPLLACFIDDWCERQRRLAFAWREGQLMVLRDPDRTSPAHQWDQLWQDYFDRLCARMGVSAFGVLTKWFFDSASALHMLRWRRPVDRAALEELCAGWAAWISGGLAPQNDWFAVAQADAQALAAWPDETDPVAEAVAHAAAQVLSQRGVTGLTHRAVATEADLTLGIVSYKYRTSADLLRAAFDALYRRMLSRGPSRIDEDAPMTAREAIGYVEQGLPNRADMLGSDELMVATARDPQFQAFAAQLRYLRGRASGRILQAVVGPDRSISAIDGAIFSALIGARGRARITGGMSGPDDFAPLAGRLMPADRPSDMPPPYTGVMPGPQSAR